MRYAIFTDIHANLEALEAVLAQIDELAQVEAIDQIWFLGDLVGYGPNPNECIDKLRERTDVIIAGNHDWAAVGKIDLEDFSEAARVSAEWTMQQLTEDHRQFLINLPERLEIGECTLVHGSPYGPLWEYLTSEVLAERSFQHFTSRFCFVGHTHVPIIFQQLDPVANMPTLPLGERNGETPPMNGEMEEAFEADNIIIDDEEETTEVAAVRLQQQLAQASTEHAASDSTQNTIAEVADEVAKLQQVQADDTPTAAQKQRVHSENGTMVHKQTDHAGEPSSEDTVSEDGEDTSIAGSADDSDQATETTPEETIQSAEDRLNEEIEELLTLLGLSQSMVNVSNEMIDPPEGEWLAPEGYRAIVNPGGVGQPRDGDPRAAFMIYDTEEQKITFYRIPYPFETTQEKIIKAGLPRYLATRLAYGR
jgi:diadenosine tetraphosphatase ApaH/serine/threonine PP2A family protein phosphatase